MHLKADLKAQQLYRRHFHCCCNMDRVTFCGNIELIWCGQGGVVSIQAQGLELVEVAGVSPRLL